jgi:FdhD protein
MDNKNLTYSVTAIDEKKRKKSLFIPAERPLTLYLNKRELITIMTLGMNTKSLVIGYLKNQHIISSLEQILSIQIDWDVNAAVINTVTLNDRVFDSKKTVTSGCGQGTMFGDVAENLKTIKLNEQYLLSQGILYEIINKVRLHDSVYRKAGSVHGCALFRDKEMLFYFEDIGRHNAVDAIAGKMWEEKMSGEDLVFYTTGRLTSEMVIKGAQMGIPFLLSRSGVTQMGVEMARKVNLTLLGRCSGKHFYIYHGENRILFNEPD